MKVVQLVAENVKKLRAVEITPDGNLVEITGKNGAGKSSVLDSIMWALAGAKHIQAVPIRRGEDRARIRLDLGELVVERRFTSGGSTLTVSSADGARYSSPQSVLDSLLGALSFDPLAFVGQDPKAQFDTLRAVAGVELDLERMERENRRDFDARTELNRRAKSLRSQAEALPVPKSGKGPVDTAQLKQRMVEAANAGAARAMEAARRENVVASLKVQQASADKLRAELAERERRIALLDAEIREWEPLPEPLDVAAIRTELDAAESHNRMVESGAKRQKLQDEAKALEAEAEALTAVMQSRTDVKDTALAEAKMPIDGLSLGDGIVLYQGVPLEQASTAEQLKVSVGLAMAANPKLRVLRIKEGSLLDEDNLRLIAEMAQEHDYQVWVERVDASGRVGFVIEDGMVVNVEQEVGQ